MDNGVPVTDLSAWAEPALDDRRKIERRNFYRLRLARGGLEE